MVFTVVAQCAVMCVAAAHASVSKYSADRNTVFIDLYGDEKDADASTTGNEGGSTTGNEAGSAAGNGTGGVAGSDVVSPDFVTQFPGSLFWSGLQTQVPAGEPAVQEVYEEMPAFVQEAYEDALYGSGTVASCGSSVTSLAMVATYLTGYEYRPDELARSFAGKADTDVVRTVSGCDALGLPYEETKEWGDIYTALQDGKCAILQLDEKSVFSEAWHFVVLKSVTEDGKILINDPCEANYKKESLKEGFASGFEESVLKEAMCWGLIFDRSAVPEDIQRYEESIGDEEPQDRYFALELSPEEKQLLARVVCVLGRGECVEGQQAMVEVLLNRMLSKEFPDELRTLVCSGKEPLCDVSLLDEAVITKTDETVVTRAIHGPYILEIDVTEFTDNCHE